MLIEQKNVRGELVAGQKRRTRPPRSPELFAAVRHDLAAYRLAVRRAPMSDGRQLLFSRPDGEPWRDHDWRNWRRRVFKPAIKTAGLPITRPYDLRHACASLLLHAGWPITDAADHMGHTIATLAKDYAHVIAELKGQKPVPVDQAIAAARQKRARAAV